MKLCFKKHLIILLIFLFYLNKSFAGYYGGGLLFQTNIWHNFSKSASKIANPSPQLFLSDTKRFKKSGIGLYGFYDIYLFDSKDTKIQFYTSLIYNFKDNVALYQLGEDIFKSYSQYYENQKKEYSRSVKEDEGFDKYFNNELPVSFLELKSFTLPLKASFIYKTFFLPIFYSIGIASKLKYYFSIKEKVKNGKYKNVNEYYHKFYLDIAFPFELSIFFLEDLIQLSLEISYGWPYVLFKGKNKPEPTDVALSQKLTGSKLSHQQSRIIELKLNLKINILSLFVFPPSKPSNYEKNIPVHYS